MRPLAGEDEPVLHTQLGGEGPQPPGLRVARRAGRPGGRRRRRARPRAARRAPRTARSKPLRSTRRPTASRRGRPEDGSAAGCCPASAGVKCSVSTPQGTTCTWSVGTPIRASSSTSSRHVATTASTWAATRHSRSTRSAGLGSASPWWRRLTLPSAWNVWATGTPRRRPAHTAASPDIQKCPCTTSGSPVRAQSDAIQSANRSMCGRRSSLGRGSGGPAGTCTTTTPGPTGTRSGRSGSSRRV